MTNFEKYLKDLTAEKFADSMILNCDGCPAYLCTGSSSTDPTEGIDCYENLLSWCNQEYIN